MQLKEISDISLSLLSSKVIDGEARGFFLEQPGREHYKLLAYLSTLKNGIQISDIGTYKGCSALALSYNAKNRVYSYDVSNMRKLYNHPSNIEFRLIKESYHQDILQSGLIVLDTIHDGVHEKEVIDFLIENDWKGILILDDIHYFPEQNKLWNSIKLRKEDITHLGHWSGTGIIYFE